MINAPEADTLYTSVRTIRTWFLFPTWEVYLSLPFPFYGLCRAVIVTSRWVYSGFNQTP